MEPFFFGNSGQRLFGVYHPPTDPYGRNTGVVLCYPIGQEYMRSHRAFLQLARKLSDSGFHVLRFDYYGCGDSEGSFDQCTFRRWVDDVVTAIDELREGSGVTRICLCGLRLGASVAAFSAEHQSIDGLVLWDPVVQGANYLRELRAQHRNWLRGSFAKPKWSPRPASTGEVLGFPLTKSLALSIEQLDLLQLRVQLAKQVFLLDTQKQDVVGTLNRHLQDLALETQQQHIPASPIWLKRENDLDNSIVPTALVSALVQWAERCFS